MLIYDIFTSAGGRWGPFRGAHHASGGSNLPARVNPDRHRYGATDRVCGRNMPLRGQPFPPEEELNRPFLGRHSDDPYLYDDSPHGMKRPYFAVSRNFNGSFGVGKIEVYLIPHRISFLIELKTAFLV